MTTLRHCYLLIIRPNYSAEIKSRSYTDSRHTAAFTAPTAPPPL